MNKDYSGLTGTKNIALGFVLISLLLSGCSYLGWGGSNPEVKATVTNVADTYLRYVAAGDERNLAALVYWDSLLGRGITGGISREEFSQQLAALRKRWSVQDNPLLGLELRSVSVDEDDAEVELRKQGRPDYPVIWIKLMWSGSGWVVTKDSIFGKDNLAATVLKTGNFK